MAKRTDKQEMTQNQELREYIISQRYGGYVAAKVMAKNGNDAIKMARRLPKEDLIVMPPHYGDWRARRPKDKGLWSKERQILNDMAQVAIDKSLSERTSEKVD